MREHALLFALLTAVAFGPLVLLAAYVTKHGGVLTRVNGADFYDQFQSLAWIRDEGMHGLASNLWVAGSTPHDYLQPMYLISGVLWRLGLSIQLSYLVWKPVALLVLFFGYAAYVRHMTTGGRWARAATLALALFYVTPFSPVSQWLKLLSPAHALDLVLTVDDPTAMLNLWGFEHTAIAIGLGSFRCSSSHAIASSRRAGATLVFAGSASGARPGCTPGRAPCCSSSWPACSFSMGLAAAISRSLSRCSRPCSLSSMTSVAVEARAHPLPHRCVLARFRAGLDNDLARPGLGSGRIARPAHPRRRPRRRATRS